MRDRLDLTTAGRDDGGRRLRDLGVWASRIRFTSRLRLEPVGPEQAQHLWRLHNDPGVAAWYGGYWSRRQAEIYAASSRTAWERDGVGKWMAFDLTTGELVGRGGLSYAEIAGRWRLEVGWALRSPWWGHGFATEIGRAALVFAFDETGADEVVALTERHNRRSRAVMERLGMRYVGELRYPGLVEGRDGVHEDAPFAFYTIAASAAPASS